MRILLVGAGGVGGAFAAIAARRDFFEQIVVADYDAAKAERAAAVDDRFVGAQIDASDADAVAAVCREHRITHVMNAVDPVFNMPIFDGAFAAGADYLDMAMSLSKPHPESPYERVGVKLGDEQFAEAEDWEARRPAGAGRHRRGARALRRVRAVRRRPPVLRDRRARHPRRGEPRGHRRRGQRDLRAVVLDVDHDRGVPQPAGDLREGPRGRRRRLVHHAPFSEPEVFDFPEGIGPVECVNVEHEEVLLMPRWVDCKRATFKYGLGDEFITILKVLHTLGLDSTEKVRVEGRRGLAARRGRRRAARPRHASGPRMKGKTCAGLHVTGTGKDGQPRSTYLYHVVDNEWTMSEYGHQCVVWQTAVNPVVALELARARRLDGQRRARARRPSTRCRSSTCSPSTAPRGGSGSRRDRGDRPGPAQPRPGGDARVLGTARFRQRRGAAGDLRLLHPPAG